jgi:hypothetical protein
MQVFVLTRTTQNLKNSIFDIFLFFCFMQIFPPEGAKRGTALFDVNKRLLSRKKRRQWIFTCKQSKDKFNQYFETKIKNKSSQLWQIRRSPIGIVIILVESNIA